MGQIILVLMSSVDKHVLAALKKGLEGASNRLVEVRDKISSLDYAYDSSRMQYLSPRLLSRLSRMKKDQGIKIVGLVSMYY
jgi:predicted Zn-dependent protease